MPRGIGSTHPCVITIELLSRSNIVRASASVCTRIDQSGNKFGPSTITSAPLPLLGLLEDITLARNIAAAGRATELLASEHPAAAELSGIRQISEEIAGFPTRGPSLNGASAVFRGSH